MIRHLAALPAWFRPRPVRRETVQQYFGRGAGRAATYETVHPEAVASNPLPCNVADRGALPDTRGWWGYSFRDVPDRASGETFIATIPDCRILWYRDSARAHDFFPAILTSDARALELREIRFRAGHREVLRDASFVRIPRATWVTERVYHNHSHWLTAHLPKLLLLRDRQALRDVLLPRERTAAIDESLALSGMPPGDFPTFDPARPLRVDELTIVGTDRFRPELLRLVPKAFRAEASAPPRRKVFISRARATRRRLVNEDAVWPILEAAGFERAHMEEMAFADQVQLMRETRVLLAPHGAGLTNMLFCPEGAHIVEIANLDFPNPNFYALASAMRHKYWLLSGQALGDGHPLDQDLRIDPDALRHVLRRLDAA